MCVTIMPTSDLTRRSGNDPSPCEQIEATYGQSTSQSIVVT